MVDSVLEAVHPATIDAALLSQAVTKVGECQISYGQPGQLEAILGAVSEAQDLALKTLFLGGGVVQVSPELLGTAAVKLTRLEVGDVTSGQVGEILTRVAVNEDSKLREFRILGQNLAENVRNTVSLQDLVAAVVTHLGTGNWTYWCSVNFDRTLTEL